MDVGGIKGMPVLFCAVRCQVWALRSSGERSRADVIWQLCCSQNSHSKVTLAGARSRERRVVCCYIDQRIEINTNMPRTLHKVWCVCVSVYLSVFSALEYDEWDPLPGLATQGNYHSVLLLLTTLLCHLLCMHVFKTSDPDFAVQTLSTAPVWSSLMSLTKFENVSPTCKVSEEPEAFLPHTRAAQSSVVC